MADLSKYPKELIKRIAEEIDAGMICFLNADTLEIGSVFGEGYDAFYDDDYKEFYQEVYDKVDSWENVIRFEPLLSWQSFKIMEDFIENCIPTRDALKSRLWNALSRKKPFQNFKIIVENSRYRQCWFDFKKSRLEQYVSEQLVSEQYVSEQPGNSEDTFM
ncbi:MAG: UPF0158 family protein [Tannerellaceae bacterium]|jgi:hypothetical protein|nr:UPF0158 family protein [Tannerellaceae bacterium]